MNWEAISAIAEVLGAAAVVASLVYVGRQVNRQRLLLFERRAITLWHHNFQLRRQKLLSDATWYYQNQMIRFLAHRQSMREAWSIFRNTFETSFQEYVDDQFRTADDTSSE